MKIKRVEGKRTPPGGFHPEIVGKVFRDLKAYKVITISEKTYEEIKERCGVSIEIVKEFKSTKKINKGEGE